jgi:hypothetical protein
MNEFVVPMNGFFVLAACGFLLQVAFYVWVFLTLWRMQTALSDSAEAQRQLVALGREANQLLRNRAAEHRSAKPALDSVEDWPAGGEYVIETSK